MKAVFLVLTFVDSVSDNVKVLKGSVRSGQTNILHEVLFIDTNIIERCNHR